MRVVKKMTFLRLIPLLVFLGPGSIISPASAGCPPFDSRNSYPLLDIAKQIEQEIKRNPPKAGQSDTDYMLDLWKRGVLKVSPAFILPVRGPIPLAVGAVCLWCGCLWCGGNEPVVITFNPGDGTPEIPVANKPLEAVTYVYKQTGQFKATVRLQDRQDQILTHTVLITAMHFVDFEAELKGYWVAMKEALLRGDISEALECVHSYSRSKYQEQLTKIMRGGSQRIAQEFGTLELHERREDGTIIFLRSVAGGSSEVYFQVDFDGFWRISRF